MGSSTVCYELRWLKARRVDWSSRLRGAIVKEWRPACHKGQHRPAALTKMANPWTPGCSFPPASIHIHHFHHHHHLHYDHQLPSPPPKRPIIPLFPDGLTPRRPAPRRAARHHPHLPLPRLPPPAGATSGGCLQGRPQPSPFIPRDSPRCAKACYEWLTAPPAHPAPPARPAAPASNPGPSTTYEIFHT